MWKMDQTKGNKIKILHVVGSPSDDHGYGVSIFFAGATQRNDSHEFLYAVVQTDGRWGFPTDLSENARIQMDLVDDAAAVEMIKSMNPDVILSHLYCEKGQIVYGEFLEVLDIPVLGSPVSALHVAKNKDLTRLALCSENSNPANTSSNNNSNSRVFKMAPGVIVKPWNKDQVTNEWMETKLNFPCIVKAGNLDDSIGLSLVLEANQLKNAVDHCFIKAKSVIIERFIPGTEVRVGILQRSDSTLMMLPVLDYHVPKDGIRTGLDKLTYDDFDIPIALSAKSKPTVMNLSEKTKLREELEVLAFNTFYSLKLRDFALFDIRIDEFDNPFLLEVNCFCSFGSQSVINRMARAAGISDEELLQRVVSNALNRKKNNC